jgi:hypothetical protein
MARYAQEEIEELIRNRVVVVRTEIVALRRTGMQKSGAGEGHALTAVEARKALALKGWDWSAYAMYANPELSLDTICSQQNAG